MTPVRFCQGLVVGAQMATLRPVPTSSWTVGAQDVRSCRSTCVNTAFSIARALPDCSSPFLDAPSVRVQFADIEETSDLRSYRIPSYDE